MVVTNPKILNLHYNHLKILREEDTTFYKEPYCHPNQKSHCFGQSIYQQLYCSEQICHSIYIPTFSQINMPWIMTFCMFVTTIIIPIYHPLASHFVSLWLHLSNLDRHWSRSSITLFLLWYNLCFAKLSFHITLSFLVIVLAILI
jgi:hypothetical protein